MLLSPFSSLLGKAETIVTIYKHNTRHHNQHCRSNNEIVMNIYDHDNNNNFNNNNMDLIYLHWLQENAMPLVPKLKP